jgi:hypothetical protein
MTMPLPAHDSTSTSSSLPLAGWRSVENWSMSLAAAAVRSCTWRLPSPTPVARPIASTVWSNDPRVASTAASLPSPWECFSSGRFSAASAGCRLADPGVR